MSKYVIKDGELYTAGTLAQLLDLRPIVVDEPTSSTLPSTINPLQFLFKNLFINNGILVRIEQGAMNTNNSYLKLLTDLYYVLPPEQAALIVIHMEPINELLTIKNDSEDVNTYTVLPTQVDKLNNNWKERISISLNQRACK